MNLFAHAALIGWPIIALVLFSLLPPRRAVLASLIGAYLFLPMSGYDLPGLSSYDKTTAATLSTLLGVLLFDPGRLLSFRPSPFDLPILLWCFAPPLASITNGLGVYDAGSGLVRQIFGLGVPYLLGRIYFTDLASLRELAIGIFVGGLLYVPLCLFEIRMSPQLHTIVYGWYQHSFAQTKRFGGWRPTVFMQHGLAVGFWMTIATLAGGWLWWTGAVRKMFGLSVAWLVVAICVTTILCKSFGALVLGAIGAGTLLACRQFRSGIPLVILSAIPISYIAIRAPDLYDGSHLLAFAESMGNEERADSLRYRLDAEGILSEHAWKRPVFGWGGWGRNRPASFEEDVKSVATDGLWIIFFGSYGMFGMIAFYAIFLLPGLMAWKVLPATAWGGPAATGAAVAVVVSVLFVIDSLFNAMLSPVYLLLSGALTGAAVSPAFTRAVSLANSGVARQRRISSPTAVSANVIRGHR